MDATPLFYAVRYSGRFEIRSTFESAATYAQRVGGRVTLVQETTDVSDVPLARIVGSLGASWYVIPACEVCSADATNVTGPMGGQVVLCEPCRNDHDRIVSEIQALTAEGR